MLHRRVAQLLGDGAHLAVAFLLDTDCQRLGVICLVRVDQRDELIVPRLRERLADRLELLESGENAGIVAVALQQLRRDRGYLLAAPLDVLLPYFPVGLPRQ